MISLNRSALSRAIILSSILIPLVASSQVKIIERVEIKPRFQGKGPITLTSESWPGPGSLAFQRGGVLTIGLSFPDGTIPCLMNGRAVQERIEDPPIVWGQFTQWSGSNFVLQSKNPDDQFTFIPHAQSSSIIGGGIDYGFLIYCRPEDPEAISVAYWVQLVPDSSEAMPPQWYLDYEYGPGDPFDKTRAAVVQLPFECTYRIVVSQAKATATNDVLMTLPDTRLLWSNVATHVGDTIIVGPYPRGTQIQLALVSGVRTLVKGDTLYPQAADLGNSLEFHFEDWTDETFNDVVIRMEPNAGTPDHLEIAADTDPIWYGDTTYIAIKPTDISGNLSPLGFDSDFEFSIELLPETQQYGTLLYNGDSGTYFDHVPSVGGTGVGVQFAANGLEPDSTVFLRFHLREYYSGGIIPTGAGKDVLVQGKLAKGRSLDAKRLSGFQQKAELNSAASADKKTVKLNNAVDQLENDWCSGEGERTILLGETKYYQARLRSLEGGGNTLLIEELGVPAYSGAHDVVKGKIWEGSPVSQAAGDKLGVYWERKDSAGKDLPDGLIRLIGRYYDVRNPDNVYKVQLTATHLGVVRSALIEVKKPGNLGNNYSVVTDVKGHPMRVDEEIIKYAGQWGIPPQIMKAQIDQETVPKFTPVWRYEPFTDLDNQKKPDYLVNKDGSKKLWVVDDEGLGGDFPNDHLPSCVTPTDYEKSRQSIYGFLEDHFERYVDRVTVSVVYKNDYAALLTKDLKQCYREALTLGLRDTKKNKDAANFAIELIKNRFHWKEYGSVYSGYAQTRIATSYGHFQMMYPTAVATTFEETGSFYDSPGALFMNRSATELPPEKLNEHEYLLPRHVDFTLQHLRKALGNPSMIPESNWTMGFERTWIATLQKHNPYRLNYGLEVLSKSSHYWPSTNK